MGPALPFVAIGAMMLSTAMSAVGQIQASQAAAQADKYNASIAMQKAEVAKQNAIITSQAGAQQAMNQGLKTRAEVGAIEATKGASNVVLNQDSNESVKISARQLGYQDAMTIRSEAAKHAFGYTSEAASLKAESALDRFKASSELTAGLIGAGSTLLSGVGKAAGMGVQFGQEGVSGFGADSAAASTSNNTFNTDDLYSGVG